MSSSVTDSDPVASYQRCLHRVEEARKRIEAMVEAILNAADRLKDNKWKLGETSSVGQVINYAGWPTGQELEGTLRIWQEATQKSKVVWAAIPPDRRIGLKTPKEYE